MTEQAGLLWTLLCVVLVFLMQPGFLMLASGLSRGGDGGSAGIRLIATISCAYLAFWTIGYSLMFGASRAGLLGTPSLAPDFMRVEQAESAFFLIQFLFCATAVMIAGAATSGRVRFGAVLLFSVWTAALVYPVMGHWFRAGQFAGVDAGWLGAAGFVDFAGSTVVFSFAGWAALAVLAVLGRRADAAPGSAPRTDITQASLGSLLLFVGWLGFNGANSLSVADAVPGILANTLAAGAAGSISAGFLGQAVHGRVRAEHFIFGCLGGLVAVGASCAYVSTAVAGLIGFIAGMLVIAVERLLDKTRIDDALGIIPVYLAAGVWGSVAVALYGHPELLGTGLDRSQQLLVQVQGVLACGLWAFGLTYGFARLLNWLAPLEPGPLAGARKQSAGE